MRGKPSRDALLERSDPSDLRQASQGTSVWKTTKTSPAAANLPTGVTRDVELSDPCPCGSGKKAERCCLKA
ncbi:SEC-C metal-binding domain-containing protein [Reyranella sp.]|uniref:SEC-C metal-binding domain-containing protein n=1 Tax=Reyranella sp. TaxID=1929291 RepID=UPI0039C99AC3